MSRDATVATRAVRRETMTVLAGLVLALGAVLATATPASAHATLVSVSPTSGSTLTTAPQKVTLTFDENVRTPSTLIVSGPSGRVDHGSTEVVDNHVSVAVGLSPRPAEVGAYRVAYRVVSADGHPVSGESSFDYRPPGVRAAPVTSHSRGPGGASDPRTDIWWVLGGAALVVAVATLLLAPRRGRGPRP